jgi:hypothetical protein
MIPDFVPQAETEDVLSVQVQRLDDYVRTKGLSNISLIKIDTEGFELPVLLGASRFFSEQKRNLPPVVAEITPRAFRLMNRSIGELEEFMSGYGYKAYAVCGCHRIDITKITNQTEVLFKM